MTTRRRMSSYRVLAAAAALGTAVGCSDDTPVEALTSDQFAQAREAYDRGARAYDDHDWPRASVELARADELVPDERVAARWFAATIS